MGHFPPTFLTCVIAAETLLALIGSTRAASFDCGAATAARERLICADPELSHADEELAAAFNAALAKLSEEGQVELRQN